MTCLRRRRTGRIRTGRIRTGRIRTGRIGPGRIGPGRIGTGRCGAGRIGTGRDGLAKADLGGGHMHRPRRLDHAQTLETLGVHTAGMRVRRNKPRQLACPNRPTGAHHLAGGNGILQNLARGSDIMYRFGRHEGHVVQLNRLNSDSDSGRFSSRVGLYRGTHTTREYIPMRVYTCLTHGRTCAICKRSITTSARASANAVSSVRTLLKWLRPS